jgi:ribosome-associated protein
MDALRIDDRVVIPAADLSWSAARSSGPGGQNVNKVASKVDLRFDLEGTSAFDAAQKARLRASAGARIDAEGRLVIVSQATRDQSRNLEDARAKLREIVLRALRPPKKRRATKPSRASKEDRLRSKKALSAKKEGRRRGDW